MSEAARNIKARLDRVEQHLDSLHEVIQSFVSDDATYDVYPDQRTGPDEVVIYGRALRNPPSLEWAPVISDIVNGTMAALDNLIWALSLKYQRRLSKPLPRGRIGSRGPFGEWREIGFPVSLAPKDWKSRCMKELVKVDPVLLPVFHDVQPFFSGQHAPERESLAVVHELWNIDKHRHVPLVSVGAGGEESAIRIFTPDFFQPRPQFRITSIAPRRILRLKTETELARAEIIGAGPDKAPASEGGLRDSF